jgi:hypothetical protein
MVRAVDLISLLQEFVSQHGDKTEIAIAVTGLSQPLRQDIGGAALDREIRQPDEPDPDPTGPPLVWLIPIAPGPHVNPYAPRRACIPSVFPTGDVAGS